ncbi:hypothetical protein ACVBIL_10665 [Shewanella sp. 125m-7]
MIKVLLALLVVTLFLLVWWAGKDDSFIMVLLGMVTIASGVKILFHCLSVEISNRAPRISQWFTEPMTNLISFVATVGALMVLLTTTWSLRIMTAGGTPIDGGLVDVLNLNGLMFNMVCIISGAMVLGLLLSLKLLSIRKSTTTKQGNESS